MSEEINDVFKEVLDSTIKTVYGEFIAGEKIPFRKVICDGDDVTVICLAQDAFKFVKEFMNELSTKSLTCLDAKPITAGAGVAIVKFGFPFYTAYNVAEELCSSAKKKSLDLGYIKDTNKSSVDYHVCYGGVTTDIKEFRKKNYIKDTYELALRPYIFGTEGSLFDFHSFENALEDFYYIDKNGKRKSIARSKLKGLRNIYSKNYDAVTEYGEMLKARHKDQEDEIVAVKLAEPFVKSSETEGDLQFAKYFDVLDVLDFIAPADKEEDE